MKPIFLIGFMGSGKTTFGKLLAKTLNLRFIDADTFIEQQAGRSIPTIFQEVGEDGFRQMEKEALQALAAMQDVVVATGGGMPCFFDNLQVMKDAGLTIYLEVSVTELANRLQGTGQQRPLLKDKSFDELKEYVATALDKRRSYYEAASCRVDAGSPDVMYNLEQLVRYYR